MRLLGACLLVLLPLRTVARDVRSKFAATMDAAETARFVQTHLAGVDEASFVSGTADIMAADVEALRFNVVAPFLVKRVAGSDANARVQKHIVAVFEGLGWAVEQDTFEDNTPLGTVQFNNIIATKNPKAKRRLVLAAHFDSKYFKDFDFIGATDSAVPCAILVSIAHSLNKLLDEIDSDSNTTVQMIFFDGEEAFKDWTASDSLYGSRHLAQKWEKLRLDGTTTGTKKRTYLTAMDAFILLDLIGDPDSKFVNLNHDTYWMWDRIVSIEQRLAKSELLSHSKNRRINVEGEAGYFEGGMSPMYHGVDDDHRPFQQRGVPIVHVIALPFPKHWHKVGDNGDHVDPEVGRDLTLIFAVLVAEYLGLA